MDSRTQAVRVRIAPSPTGPIHLGNVHTALFNWLFARQRGGSFVLRFEDTDRARSEQRWEDVMYEELAWLGLDWDEAPDRGGPYAPYRQSERLELYRAWAQRLLSAGAAYECYCTVDAIEAERQAAAAAGYPYQYRRKCRDLAPEGRAELRAGVGQPAIRFAIPPDRIVKVQDLVRGEIEFATATMGDPIIVRPNGMPLYNFAVVVDDLTMRITHVLRGEGHISNTPLQVLMYEALGEPLPVFGHFGHITGAGGAKMSKRRGEGYIGHYREVGILPEAMLNYLALLAWTPGGDREILSPGEVLAEFAIERVSASPSQFDLPKLLWVNGNHIRRLSVSEFAARCLPYLETAGLIEPGQSNVDEELRRRVEGACAMEQPRVETLSQIVPALGYLLRRDIAYNATAIKLVEQPAVRDDLARARQRFAAVSAWEIEALESAGGELLSELGKSARAVYQPIRAAVTGRTASPPLFDVLYWLGREWSLERLERVASGGELLLATAEPEDDRG